MAALRLPREGRQLGLLLAATGMFLVSTDSLFIRIADADGWTIAFMSSVWSTPIMWCIAVRSLGRDLPERFNRHRGPLLASSLLGSFSMTAFVTAVTKTDVANVVAIIAAAPIFAAVIARVALGERAAPRTWRAIAATIAGILVIVGGSLSGDGLTGNLLALFAICCFGANLSIWRRSPDLSRMLLVALTATFTMLATAVPANPSSLDRNALLATLAMGSLFGPAARFCMSMATRYAPPAEVSLFTPVETVCATVWVWLWFDEVPPTATFIGAAIVLTAVTYGVTGPAAEVAPTPTPHT
ncbi:MAG: DMT family transporter [Acidimicrobiales bacterium]|jgi:drug/metabolite transporter (DMT)-like permease|nr:DMT family transporter [Acidimicrobiales bacterium]|tara:strand:+ start:685 stop:1581 length:897 start_codon:yes stop_codon:yes gene_type:complete